MKGRDGAWHHMVHLTWKSGPMEMWPPSPSCTHRTTATSHTHTPHYAWPASGHWCPGRDSRAGILGAPHPLNVLSLPVVGVVTGNPENQLVPSCQEAAAAGPPTLQALEPTPPAPAPAVLLPSEVMGRQVVGLDL